MYKDPYKTLGVSPEATDDEIKKVYRTLSRKYHPDANIGKPNAAEAEEMFKNINIAYDEIMDMRSKGYDYRAQSSSATGGYSSQSAGYRQNGYANTNSYSQYGNRSTYGGAYGYGAGNAYQNANAGFGGFESFDSARSNYTKGWVQVDKVRLSAVPDGEILIKVVDALNAFQYTEAKQLLSLIKTRSGMYYYLSALTFMRLNEIATAYYQAKLALTMEPSNPAYMELYVKLQSGNTMYNKSSEDFMRDDRRTAIISGSVLLCFGGSICCTLGRVTGPNMLWMFCV